MASLTKMRMALLGAAGLLAMVVSPAAAQDTAPWGAPSGARPIELSVGGAGVWTWATSGGSLRAMITIPRGERRSIEIFGGPYWGSKTQGFPDDVLASFGFQSVRRVDGGGRPGFKLFLTSGLEGFVMRQPASNCFAPGCFRQPRTLILPPFILIFGLGAQKTLSPHTALRVEAQGVIAAVVPLGARLGISLSVPLGQVYATGKGAVRR
jgi:hypothetical protein